MKKTLIALAALAAAGTASAQSSVTLFGVLDAGLSHYSVSGGPSQTAQSTSGSTASRFGFRGTEDLGGGLSANFWLESAVSVDDGGPAGLNFQRRSTVSLAGAFGEVRLGRDLTPTFYNDQLFSPFGVDGVGGNLISQARNSGSPPFFAPAATVGTTPFAVNDPNYARSSNSIGYFLPGNLGGFYGQAMYSFDEQTSPALGSQGRYAGFRVGYANGPVDAALAHGKTTGAPTPTAAKPDVASTNIGASYNLDIVKLMGEYSRTKVTGDASVRTIKGYLLGLTAPVGAGQVRASYARATADIAGVGADPRSSKIAVGYLHNLSKRTALYASYARLSNANGAQLALGGLKTTNPTLLNRSSTGYDFGLRHSF
ncbi:MAG: porin [Polaromonas sp.]